MLKLLLLTAGTWTAISALFTWRLAVCNFFTSDRATSRTTGLHGIGGGVAGGAPG